jgi:hypothetical protein
MTAVERRSRCPDRLEEKGRPAAVCGGLAHRADVGWAPISADNANSVAQGAALFFLGNS